MRVHVYETWGHHVPAHVDVFRARRSANPPDYRYAVALDQDVAAVGGRSGPVDYSSPAQHHGMRLRHYAPLSAECARKLRGFSRTRRFRVSSSTPASRNAGKKTLVM